jgi:hypothetical protein
MWALTIFTLDELAVEAKVLKGFLGRAGDRPGLGGCGQHCLRRWSAQPGVDVVPEGKVVARQRRTSDT